MQPPPFDFGVLFQALITALLAGIGAVVYKTSVELAHTASLVVSLREQFSTMRLEHSQDLRELRGRVEAMQTCRMGGYGAWEQRDKEAAR